MLRILKQYYPIRNLFFIIGEGLLIYCSVLFATWIITGDLLLINILLSRKAGLITFICVVCLYYNDLYNLKTIQNISELAIRLLQSLGFSSIILSIIFFLFPNTIINRWAYIVSVILSILLIFVWRISYRFVLDLGVFNQKIILMGSSDLINNIYKEINNKMDDGYEIALLATENGVHAKSMKNTGLPEIQIGKDSDLYEIVKKLGIRKIIVALKEKRDAFPLKALLDCRIRGIQVIDGNSFYEMLTGKLSVEQINPAWLIFSDGFRTSYITRVLKRVIDLSIASIMLIILSPLIVIITIIIKIDSKGPVIFTQERVGEKKKQYRIYKLRSMIEDAEKKSGPKWAEDDDHRITRFGRFIRKTRMDELPQLWNVIKGDMSFVGPRPERSFFVEKLEKKVPYYDKRFSVKPGITGWAQVSYGYGASIEDAIEKLNYELFYIKNMSIFMDFVIIVRTIKTVLFKMGAR